MKNLIKGFLAALLSLCGMATYANSVTLIVINGQLMGADNVLVNGTEYNVRFIDGVFSEVFGNNGSGFDFTNAFDSRTASTALGAQVFNNNIYDEDYTLTNGCSASVINACFIGTPYRVDNNLFYGEAFVNYSVGGSPDALGTFEGFTTTAPQQHLTIANWELATPIPEPSAALLMASGLFAFGGVRRRKRT